MKKERLITLTVADKPEKASILLSSLRHYGHDFHVLGAGQPWHGGDMKSFGGGQKIVLMKEFLNAQTFTDDDIILFTDGFDSFVCGSPEDFLVKWRQFQCDVVFGAESVNWPGYVKDQPKQKNRFQFLNSGGYIGRANSLKRLFNSKHIQNSDDDQGYCQELYVEALQKGDCVVRLDVDKRIFCCLSDHLSGLEKDKVTLLKFEQRRLWHLGETNSYPLQLHGNGPGKELWFQMAQQEKFSK